MFARELRAVTLRVAAYGCAFAAMGLVAVEFVTLPRIAIVAEGGPESEWIEVAKPFPAFAMTIAEFEDAARYASWRHANGGGRRDVFTFVAPAGGTAVVELYRAGAATDAAEEDITASIGELRLSARPALPATIDTKFSPVAAQMFTDHPP